MNITLHVTHPDGSQSDDRAFGNTQRTVAAAAASLAHSYQLDGCTVVFAAIEEADPPSTFEVVVRIAAPTLRDAEEVVRERLGHDEPYGFPYTLTWGDVRIPSIDYEEEGFTNRILFDVWTCIMESERIPFPEMLAMQNLMKDDEQGFWDRYIGPMIDRVADDFRERKS